MMSFRRMWEAKNFGVFEGEFHLIPYAHPLAHYFGIGHKNAFFALKGNRVEAYFDADHLKQESVHGLTFFNDAKKVNKIQLEEKKLGKQTEKVIKDFFKMDLSKLSDKELMKKFEYYVDLYVEMHGLYALTQPACLEKFSEQVKNELAHYGGDHIELFLELSTPTEPSIIAQEEMARKKMYIAFLQGKDKEPLIEKYLRAFRFLNATEGNKPATPKTVLENFKQNKKDINTLEIEVNEIQESYKILKKKQLELINRYKISSEVQKKLDVLKHFSNSRLLVRSYWSALIWPYAIISDEIGERLGIPYPVLTNYTLKEIGDALLKKKKVSSKVIADRAKFGIVLLKNGKISILSGNKAKAFYEKNVPKEASVNFVKGMIANKGMVKGIAKVITFHENVFEQMKEMKRGQILVVGQTRPFLMPAIEKASAIVADEGGITSHAAIVSREFNIPCIVGTHNATRVFKNGDKIIVDANNGIAKKTK